MGLTVKLDPRLVVLSRLKLLHGVVSDIAKDIGASEFDLSVIRKGIIDQQLLSRIEFYYRDANEKVVCHVALIIDWPAHRISVSSNGDAFSVDPRKSIAEQVSEVFPVLTKHINEIRKFYNVRRVQSFFMYTAEVCSDPRKHAEARRFLSLVDGSYPDISDDLPRFRYKERYSAEELRELGVEIEHP